MTAGNQAREERWLGGLWTRVALFAGVPGLFLLGLGAAMTAQAGGEGAWERFLRGYLAAFCFALSICLGALFFTMLQHLTRAGWSVVVRRIAEGLASNLRWMWILFVPVAIGMQRAGLYEWTHPGHDPLLIHKQPFLNPTFWLLRAALYFAVWAGLSHYFLRASAAQDESGDPRLTLRMQRVAAPAMILYAFTQTFAIIDWVMSLEPHWFSTMFGVYYFAASCCGFGATLILACVALQRSGRLTDSITTDHYHDLGKFLFAFGVCFWGYIGFSQYMLIWYANLTEETTWFLVRQLGGWNTLSYLLVFGHFLVPFFLLITRTTKRAVGLLTAVAAWMLFIHFIDMYWLVMPRYPTELVASVSTWPELLQAFETGTNPATGLPWRQEYDLHWRMSDACCLLGMAALVAAGTAAGLRSVSLLPRRDPRLPESLAFENY
jgi:hypothetical protein